MAPGYRWDQEDKTLWSYWAHELGHLSGFSHGGNPRSGGSFNGFDVMYNQDGHTRIFSGWWRFVKGWFATEQVYCEEMSTLKESTLTLEPLNKDEPGLKLGIIRINENQAIVLESRRASKFDPPDSKAGYDRKNNGVLAYLYDGRFGHLQDYFTPIASNEALAEYNWDGKTRFILRPGDIAQYDRLRIEVLSSEENDVIKLSAISESEAARPRPTPRPAPSPTTTNYDREPDVRGGAVRTSETTGESTWHGQFFLSYRILVISTSKPNAQPMFDSGVVNDYRSPIVVKLSGITCKRDETEVAIFYSGVDGTGYSKKIEQSASLSAVNSDPTNSCIGYWTNSSTGKS
jgi:hypothetical protein